MSKSLTFDRHPFLRIFVLLLWAFQTSTLNHYSFPFFFQLGLMCGALYVHRVFLWLWWQDLPLVTYRTSSTSGIRLYLLHYYLQIHKEYTRRSKTIPPISHLRWGRAAACPEPSWSASGMCTVHIHFIMMFFLVTLRSIICTLRSHARIHAHCPLAHVRPGCRKCRYGWHVSCGSCRQWGRYRTIGIGVSWCVWCSCWLGLWLMCRVGRPDAHGCHRCWKGQLQEKKSKITAYSRLRWGKGYWGTKQQGDSHERVSAEKEKKLTIAWQTPSQGRGSVLRAPLSLTMLYTWVLRHTCECRMCACERCQGCIQASGLEVDECEDTCRSQKPSMKAK